MDHDSYAFALNKLHACEDAYIDALAHPDPTGDPDRRAAIQDYQRWAKVCAAAVDETAPAPGITDSLELD